MTSYNHLIPVFLITGFLGSGKTTLLNRMLRHPGLADAAVLINEFGEVGIDHYLVQGVRDDTVILASGCVCCTLRDDLKRSIMDLHGRRDAGEVPAYARLIIETTGLADPSPIIHTLMADLQLRHRYRLGAVITTVDAVNGWGQIERDAEPLRQVVAADRIVLTKTDMAPLENTNRLAARLAALNAWADLTMAPGGLDVARLLAADLYATPRTGGEVARWLGQKTRRVAPPPDPVHAHGESPHDAGIDSFCMTFDRPLNWTAFGIWLSMLLHRHGEAVLRVKGLLNVDGADTPVVINGVQHIVHPPFHLEAWPDQDHRSRIVFIVRALPRARLEESLAVFNRLAGA